ncbi:hypothetical protein [Parafrigoribacterium mesophilum]|uniref:hypothetical protein n=1 Tax=Parafrigoribacterium mesophilum TaxID=433646 RepID=UPI0031FDF1F4
MSATDTVQAVQLRPRSRGERRPPRTRLDAYPRDPLRRWLLRTGFALPFLAAAILNSIHPAGVSVNAGLLQHAAQIPWDSGNSAWIGDLFPPISTAIAVLAPGGRLGLAVIGAVAAGIVLQKVVEILAQRRVPMSTTALLVIALGANPLFFFTALENLPAFLGLSFFGLALADIVRFVSWGSTQSGFRAGLFLMLATMTDRSAVLYVVAAIVAASFLRLSRSGQRGARIANTLVIAYPAAAAVGSVLLLNLMFLREPFGLAGDILVSHQSRLESVAGVFTTPYGALVIASVTTAWLMSLVVRRPGGIIVATLAFAALSVGFVLGLVPPESSGNTFMMMTMLCIALIPTARAQSATRLVSLVAVAQIVIAWIAVIERPEILDWLVSLIGTTASVLG